MGFSKVRYEADAANGGGIHILVVSDNMVPIVGTPPVAAVNQKLRAKTTRSPREYGLRPRQVTISRVVPVAGQTRDLVYYADVPVVTPADYASPAYAEDATLTYLGETWTIVSRKGEAAR